MTTNVRFLHIRGTEWLPDADGVISQEIAAKGGISIAYVVDGVKLHYSLAACNDMDHFCYARGRDISEGRLVAGLRARQRLEQAANGTDPFENPHIAEADIRGSLAAEAETKCRDKAQLVTTVEMPEATLPRQFLIGQVQDYFNNKLKISMMKHGKRNIPIYEING